MSKNYRVHKFKLQSLFNDFFCCHVDEEMTMDINGWMDI